MTDTTEVQVFTVQTFTGARHAYREKDLRQALYDAGEVVMADVLVNLHGDEHRARRRLENRLFRRDTHRRVRGVDVPAGGRGDARAPRGGRPGASWCTSATS